MRAALCVLSTMLTTVALGAEPDLVRWQRDIVLPELNRTAVVAVPFDSSIFAATRDGFPDVRLRRGDGTQVSFLVRPAPAVAQTTTTRRFWKAPQTGVKLLESGGLQVLLEVAQDDPLPEGLRIVTPLRDFELQVLVESSADGETWTAAGDPAVIFDYSQHIDARHLHVPIKSTHRRLRLTVNDVTAEQESQLLELNRQLRGGEETERSERTTLLRRPFRIDRIDFFRDQSTVQTMTVLLRDYPAAGFAVREDVKERQTILTFQTQREPLTRIRIITEAENFSRSAMVEAAIEKASGGEAWRPLASGPLTRFTVGALATDERTLAIGESRAGSYRVVIENRDSPPLKITGVEVSGPVYEAVFLASAGDALHLDYGSPDAKAGEYDTAALQAALSSGSQPLAATLGAPRENLTAPTEPKWTPWNDPAVMIGGIIALTLILGWGLYTAGNRVDTLNKPPTS